MVNKFKYFGHVNSQGKISIYDKASFERKVQDFLKGKNVEFIIQERQYEFSNSMRSYYFGVIIPEIQKAFQMSGVLKSRSECDDSMRFLFLYYEVINEETGKYEKQIHTLRKDDTSVSSKMMKEFCEMCIIWCATNLDWAIPFPNEIFTFQDMTMNQRKSESARNLESSTF